MSLPKIITCYTTVGGEVEARTLIRQLLDIRLIACGVSWSVYSQYNWQDESHTEGEFAVLMKSSVELKDRLLSRIQDFHPYELPCILIREVECNPAYYDWVNQHTV